MRIFKTKSFHRLAASNMVPDASLAAAIARADSGLADAQLGKFLFKLRVPRPGQGRSGGYRVIVVIRSGNFALFVFLFAKNEKDSLSVRELDAYRLFATEVGAFEAARIDALADEGTWMEVSDDPPPQPGAGGAARSRKRSS